MNNITLDELKCFLIEYEKQINEAIIKKCQIIEDYQFQKGKLHANKVFFELLTNPAFLEKWRLENA